MILLKIRMDVRSNAINDGFSPIIEAPLRGLLVVVGGLVGDVVADKNYSMLMCDDFYLFVRLEDKWCILR